MSKNKQYNYTTKFEEFPSNFVVERVAIPPPPKGGGFLAPNSERIAGWRLTEIPALYGLVVRERGELIEYISFEEMKKRLEAVNKKVQETKKKG